GRLQRLTRKPATSAASIGCRPSASPAARARSIACGEVAAPATTSTSFITGGGLKKCMPTTRPGPFKPAAIAVTLSDEVLVAASWAIPAPIVPAPTTPTTSGSSLTGGTVHSRQRGPVQRDHHGRARGVRRRAPADRPLLPRLGSGRARLEADAAAGGRAPERA